MEDSTNISLNDAMYKAAEKINSGCDMDFIDDLCGEIAEEHNKEVQWVKLRVKCMYNQYFENGNPIYSDKYANVK